MKVSVHTGWLVFFALLLIVATYFIIEYFNEPSEVVTLKPRKNYDIVTFRLPNTSDPDVFGPAYWKARHFMAELTPCPGCRIEAVSHEKFFHDWVNKKTKKDFFDKANYDEWVKKICENKPLS